MESFTSLSKEFKTKPHPSFRTAFVLKPGFKFTALLRYCNEIKFATDGSTTNLKVICHQIEENMLEFDPELDCVVPVGTATVNLLAGIFLGMNFPNQHISVAIYNKASRHGNRFVADKYIFYDVPTEILGGGS